MSIDNKIKAEIDSLTEENVIYKLIQKPKDLELVISKNQNIFLNIWRQQKNRKP